MAGLNLDVLYRPILIDHDVEAHSALDAGLFGKRRIDRLDVVDDICRLDVTAYAKSLRGRGGRRRFHGRGEKDRENRIPRLRHIVVMRQRENRIQMLVDLTQRLLEPRSRFGPEFGPDPVWDPGFNSIEKL